MMFTERRRLQLKFSVKDRVVQLRAQTWSTLLLEGGKINASQIDTCSIWMYIHVNASQIKSWIKIEFPK